MSPTWQKQEAAARRQAAAERERSFLLDTGFELVCRQGVATLGIRDVLEEADLGTRAFYRHFASKDEFLVAIWTRETDKVVARLEKRIARAPSPEAAVGAWIDDRVRRVFKPSDGDALLALWRDGYWLRNAFPLEFRAVTMPPVLLLQGVLTDGQEAGDFPDCDPVLDAATIHTTFWMLAERHLLEGAISRRAVHHQVARVADGLLGTHLAP